jgi:hypothetical protein
VAQNGHDTDPLLLFLLARATFGLDQLLVSITSPCERLFQIAVILSGERMELFVATTL